MPDAGKLLLRIIWDGNVVLGVEVKSTRPKAYRLLKGRLPDNAVQLVPLLYSVCGKAQQAAAIAAVSAAQGLEWQPNKMLERRVACEAMQENLWRLLLDWPGVLGLQQEQQQFVYWHSALDEIAAGRGDAVNLLRELCHVLLGMDNEGWKQVDSHAKLAEWQNAGQGLLAPVLAAVDFKESKLDFVGKPAANALMPAWTVTDVLHILGSRLDHEFAAMPQHEGKPMETGELAHGKHAPLLQDLLRERPTRLLTRVIARLVDLLDSAETLADENITGRVQRVSASDAAGLSVVRTARGMLLHYVRIESERVAEYFTVAPTEWNFHPQGALSSGLTGLKESEAERLMETVKYFVLSLDPCVEYEIEIVHA
jgi:coenzyme F420-reducing hydrogenase alpha subunit